MRSTPSEGLTPARWGHLATLRASVHRVALALAVLLGASARGAPREQVHFLFSMGSHPAGVVTLSREDGVYRYRSTHLFALGAGGEATREREERFPVDAAGRAPRGHVPAGLWLWHRPAPGCVSGVEELDGRTGPLCAEGPEGLGAGELRGTLRGVPFTATYDTAGVLVTLTLPSARFTRLAPGAPLPRADDTAPLLERLSAGLPLPAGEGPLAWAPPLAASEETGGPHVERGGWRAQEARALARRVEASFPEKGFDAADVDPAREDVRRGGCLAHALRFARWAARRGRQAEVVHGLVRDGERLVPHAWVRVRLVGGGVLEVDPALGGDVSRGTHLVLGAVAAGAPREALGERWMSVLSGERRVVRGR